MKLPLPAPETNDGCVKEGGGWEERKEGIERVGGRGKGWEGVREGKSKFTCMYCYPGPAKDCVVQGNMVPDSRSSRPPKLLCIHPSLI